MRYFLSHTNVAGDSVVSGYDQWLELDNFDYGVSNSVTGSAGVPMAAGKPEFSLVSFNLANETALADFIGLAFHGGQTGDKATIHAVNFDGTTATEVFDLSIDYAIVSNVQDSAAGGFTASLGFGAITVKTWDPLDPAITSQFDWDLEANKAGGEVGDAGKTGNTATIAPTRYFMAVSGLNGGSTDPGHLGWFELSDFDFGLMRETTLVASAIGKSLEASLPGFGPVHVELDRDVALTRLLAQFGSGKPLGAVRIEGVVGDGASQKAVYDLTLNTVNVVQLDDIAGGGFTLDFDYRLGELKTLDALTGKSIDVAQWNVDTFKFLTDATFAAPVVGSGTGSNTPSATAVDYFLAFSDDIGKTQGDSLDSAAKGWIRISDFNFDISRGEITPGVYTTPDHPGLTIRADTETSLAQVMTLLTSGKATSGASIKGFDSNHKLVYDLALESVNVMGVNDSADPGFSFDLDYKAVEITTKGYDPTLKLVANPVFKWDFSTDTIGDGTSFTVKASAVGVEDIAVPTRYFMMVDGLYGGSTAAGFAGWFDIDSFGQGGERNGNLLNFGDLDVTVSTDAALTTLMGWQAAGKHIDGVRIVGVVGDGSFSRVFELDASDLLISGTHSDSDRGYEIIFDYGAIRQQTFNSVTHGLTSLFQWDDLANLGQYSDKGITAPTKGAIAASADSFYIAFEGLAGDAVVVGHNNWIQVDNFEFDIVGLISGRTTDPLSGDVANAFSGIHLHLDSDVALADLLELAASGASLKGATLHGLNSALGGKLVYDLDLTNLVVTDVQESNGPGLDVTLDFGKIGLTTNKYDPITGLSAGTEKFGWDLVANKAATVDTINFAPGPKAAVFQASDHFLLIDGLNGGTADTAHGGWFDIAGYSFGLANNGRVSEGLAPALREFGSLTVEFASDAALTKMLKMAAIGGEIKGLVLEGVGGLPARSVFDLGFGDVLISEVHDIIDGGFTVNFEYGVFDSRVLNTSGGLVSGKTTTGAGWDLIADTAFKGQIVAAPVGTSASEYLVGSLYDNVISGGARNDRIYGLGGNDTLEGGTGNDFLDGGTGFDLATYLNATGSLKIDLGNSTIGQSVGGGQGIDLLKNIEGLIGSSFADVLIGNSGNNSLDGGGGDDDMRGLGGSDSYYVDSFFDIVFENPGEGSADTIFAMSSFDSTAAGEIENFVAAYTDTSGITLIGNGLANNITGAAGDDTLYGMDGDDVIDGRGGFDYMDGGNGNDTYYVDDLNDQVIEAGGGGTQDRIITSASYIIASDDDVEFLEATSMGGDIILVGNDITNALTGRNDGNDVLDGRADVDTISGLGGNDRLIGGQGIDSLTGGTGADTFVLQKLAADRDSILDFDGTTDKIELSAASFAIASTPLTNVQFIANTTGLSASVNTRFVYNTATGELHYDSNGSNAGGDSIIATFSNLVALDTGDFVVV